MTRLIDADIFVEVLIEIVPDLRNLSTKTVGKALELTPKVDAVPVIRCKDCKWNDGGEWVDCYMSGMHGRTSNKNYCSRAERKEECSR